MIVAFLCALGLLALFSAVALIGIWMVFDNE